MKVFTSLTSAVFALLVMIMISTQVFAALPTKQDERAEALKLFTLTCEKVPPVADGFSVALEAAIQQGPLDVGLREKLQLAKDSGAALKATCDQKPNLETATNPEMSGFFVKLKASVDGIAAVGNYFVLNFSTGTASDKPMTDTVENINILSKMLDDGAQFFASHYAQ